jgi:hypothetical protein
MFTLLADMSSNVSFLFFLTISWKFLFHFFSGDWKKIFIAIRTATKAGLENRKKNSPKKVIFSWGDEFLHTKEIAMMMMWFAEKNWKRRKRRERKMKVNLRLTQGIFFFYLLHNFLILQNLGKKWKYRNRRGRESHADRIIIIIMWRVENLCFMLTQSTIYQVFMSSGGCLWMDSYLLYFFLVSMQSMSVFNLLSLVKSLS